MNLTDGPRQNSRKISLKQAEAGVDRSREPNHSSRLRGRAVNAPPVEPNGANSYERLFSRGDEGSEDLAYLPDVTPDQEFSKFQSRLRKGKVRLCGGCGGVMNKTSRMMLSPMAAVFLILLGGALMGGYGLATNFYQTPWYIRFVLPALYYIGSIFLGIGTVFFFIREKIWYCRECKEINKR